MSQEANKMVNRQVILDEQWSNDIMISYGLSKYKVKIYNL